jgi:flagellar assembly factor FliW
MPLIETKYFGTKTYDPESVFDFPFGLPGFEEEKRFVFIDLEEYAPLVFLQSLNRSSLCFLSLPVLVADPAYSLAISADDLASLGIDPAQAAQLGPGMLALALVSLYDGSSATANLMAPIVVNVQKRRALQAIRMDRSYSHQHRISAQYLRSEPAC